MKKHNQWAFPKGILFVLFALFLMQGKGVAQTVTLGSGVAINGVTTSSPINIWFRRTVCQMVYTADELIAAGAVAGPINELGFFVTNNPIYNLPDYRIQMKHTTDANAGGNLEGGYTTVKDIPSYAPSSGDWDMHVLDTPFEWDGVQNIVVRVCWSRVNPTFNASGQVRIYDSTRGYKYRRNDGPGSMCGNVPSTRLNTKPQIRFIFNNVTQWSGTVSTDWFNAANWTSGVPSAEIDVLIPTGTPNDPVLSAVGNCKSLQLDGNLTLGASGQLNIYENFTNAGTYTDGGGVTNFTGALAHEISSSAELIISNLHSNSSAGLDIVSGNIIISEELQVNKGIFNTGNAVTIRSDASGTARIDELRTTCTYTLNMTDSWGDGWNGGFITVFEDGIEIGTFSAIEASSTATFEIASGSTFIINYTAGTYENENAYSLIDEDGATIFSDGTTPSTGDVFTSTATGCSFSSTIAGTITMERYIDAGETYWRYFASAVENPELSQYLDDFTTAGFPGTPFPDFPFISIYSYDETMPPGAGYVPASSTSEVIAVGKGYQVWSGDTITGTEPFLVDLVGPPNQGDITLPVTYTPSGTPSEDGWCLIGNPYASTIDWSSSHWTKTNMADATYIQDPDTQNYATYINGAGANGGSRYIASQQSFWVHAIAPSPELTIHEGVKASVDATFFKSAEIYSPGMTIQLDGGAAVDEAVLRHVDGASDSFEANLDAVKLFGGWGINPQLTLLNGDGEDLTVHSIDKGFEEWTIPVKTRVFETGIHELRFLNVAEMDVPCMQLEDTYTGIFYPIEEETVLEFELYDTSIAPRFLLHLGRDYEQWVNHVACFEDTDGSFELDLDEEGALAYVLTHEDEDWEIEGEGLVNPLVINDLAAGLYSIEMMDWESFCGENTFHFAVDQPSDLTLDADLTSETFGADGSVSLDVEGGTPPYSYVWNTGDETAVLEGVGEGTYTVTVTDANGCEVEGMFTVNSVVSIEESAAVSATEITYNAQDKIIFIKGYEVEENSEIKLYSTTGELIASYTYPSGVSAYQMALSQDLAAGIYVLKPADTRWIYRFANQ